MEKKERFVRYRRRINPVSMTVPEQSISVRVLIDRVSKGLPVNSKMRQHIPLPNDGENLVDFETGIDVITDVVDAVNHIDRIKREQKHIAEQKQKALDESLGKVSNETEKPETT